MEREKFEDKWKGAFDQAEISPSENVWNNIELDLEKAEGNVMKRKLAFFKWVAAASVIFAFAMGGIGAYMLQRSSLSSTNTLAQNNSTTELPTSYLQGTQRSSDTRNQANAETSGNNNSIINDNALASADADSFRSRTTEPTPGSADALESSNPKRETTSHSINTEQSESAWLKQQDLQAQNIQGRSIQSHEQSDLSSELKISESVLNSNNDASSVSYVAKIEDTHDTNGGDQTMLDKNRLPSLYHPRSISLTIPEEENPEQDPVASMLAKLERREHEIKAADEDKKEEAIEREKLWTSVGFAAGAFNPVNSGASLNPSFRSDAFSTSDEFLAYSTNVAKNEAKASGVSYSVGANVGTKISKRWVLQGGVNYLTQVSDYTQQGAVQVPSSPQNFKAVSISSLKEVNQADAQAESEATEKTTQLVFTAPYNVNNNVKYLSVPVQGGYVVIDKKIGLQVNAGVSTDLFIQNSKTVSSDDIENIEEGRESSPYRPVNFSGLMGTEISYRLGQRYKVALNPSLRYPFNSAFKSKEVDSYPLTFDVGLRFRYIFQ